MPARGDNITKHKKSGLFMARYTVQTPDGPRRKTIYDRRYKEVERKLSEARGDAARGIIHDDENMLLGEYLSRWLRDSQRGSVRESTFDRDSYLIRVHVQPILGRIKLAKLTPLAVQGLYRDRLDTGLSSSTVNKIHTVLHKALGQAV